MERGVLFLGHNSDSEEKIIVGIKGASIHTAILAPEEALRFAYEIIGTVERMGVNLYPDPYDEKDEESKD